jgi:carboxyl-terminal processing protease
MRLRPDGPTYPRPFSLQPVPISLNRAWCARLCLLLAAGAALAAPDRPALTPGPEVPRIARRFADLLARKHLSRRALDDTISAQAWTNYLNSLDYEHLYFLADDIAAFSARRDTLDDQLAEGNLGFAFTVRETFLERLNERYTFITNQLAAGFDLERNESYAWKRRAAPWPADAAERDILWRLKLKNEYIQRVVAAELRDTNGPPPAATNALPGAATNALPGAVTNAVPDAAAEPADPIEGIADRYTQLRTVLNDSDADWVVQRYLTAFAHAYDPHSSYLSAGALDDFNIDMQLSLVGIGALLTSEDGTAKIERIIPGGPADRDTRDIRLVPGDKIIAVGQGNEEPVSILHWPLQKAVAKIRGEKQTRVVLVVIPASDPTGSTTKTVDLIRDEVQLEEQAADASVVRVAATDGVTRPLGIIRLPTFYADLRTGGGEDDGTRRSAGADVEAILRDMIADGVHGVLLDLRNNGGGALVEAVKITGLFIDEGPVVQVRERYGRRVMLDRDPRTLYAGPLVVLVNRLSASASEIVAGALQDYGRAVIVGDTRTHGKGTVQTVESLGRERGLGALKVTTACFFRITGSSTQLRGVEPDIVIRSPLDFMELGEDTLPNAIEWAMIDPAPYLAVDAVNAVEPLRARSAARRAEDPLFAAYREFLERVESLQDAAEMPLDIATRREMARTEKELAALRDELAMANILREDDDPGDEGDLILSESLRILADLAAVVEAAQPEPAPAEPPAPPGWRERLRAWLRRVFGWLRRLFRGGAARG